MKVDWLITFRSSTAAQKGERSLKRAEILCILQRTPKQLSERGCGYCLRIRREDGMGAVELLREQRVSYGKVYSMEQGNAPRELEI